jgi:hypothetical protein
MVALIRITVSEYIRSVLAATTLRLSEIFTTLVRKPGAHETTIYWLMGLCNHAGKEVAVIRRRKHPKAAPSGFVPQPGEGDYPDQSVATFGAAGGVLSALPSPPGSEPLACPKNSMHVGIWVGAIVSFFTALELWLVHFEPSYGSTPALAVEMPPAIRFTGI